MSRDELSARALAELEALDAILAREPVAEEHLELAALVASVEGCAPKMRPEFQAELAERFGRRRGGLELRRRSGSLRGRLAFAGGGVLAFAVALTILLSGSVRDAVFGGGGRTVAPPAAAHDLSRGGALERPGQVKTPAIATPAIRSGVTAGGSAGAAAPAHVPAAAAPSNTFGAVSGGRLVAKGSSLTLATPPSQISSLASEIVSATEAQGGVVEHSNVNVQGASSYAFFALAVPSGHLGHLIAALSSLASVRALNQSTQDITSPYQSETALLARRLTELASLRKQLAAAPTATAAASLSKQIGDVEHRIAIERATIARLAGEAANATLSVQVVAGAAKKKQPAAVGALTRGYHDALHALQDILAIALIVLAIVLPFAICGLALWWAIWSVRQRARERAIRSA